MNLTVSNYFGGTMNGFSAATINTRNTGISKSSSFSTGKPTKKSLNYNAKQISSQLIRATKSRTAAAVLTKAKSTVNNLQHCLGTGEYDDSEVQIALAHAKRMVKCAQSKVSNLKQEENLQRKYEREKSAKEMQQKSEVKRRVHQKENDLKQKMATEEIQQVQKEKSRRQEIIRKRRMHRNEERSNIIVLDEVLLQVEDVQLGSAGSLSLLFQTVQLSTLTHVAGDSDDFAVVVVLFQPGNDDGGIQTARVSQNNFLNIFLFHDDRSFVYYTFYTFVCRPGIPPGALDVLSF